MPPRAPSLLHTAVLACALPRPQAAPPPKPSCDDDGDDEIVGEIAGEIVREIVGDGGKGETEHEAARLRSARPLETELARPLVRPLMWLVASELAPSVCVLPL